MGLVEWHIITYSTCGTSHNSKMPLSADVKAKLDVYCVPEAWRTMAPVTDTHIVYGSLEPGYVIQHEAVDITGAEDAIEECKAYVRAKLAQLPWATVLDVAYLGGLSASPDPASPARGHYLEAKVTLREGAEPPKVPAMRTPLPRRAQQAPHATPSE